MFEYLFAKRFPKTAAGIVLTACTGIFLFFPACILSGNTVCWDYDVTDSAHRNVLLISSAIILPLCAWVWINIFKHPKLERVPRTSKLLAALIVVLTVIIGLLILASYTSPYWGPLVGHPNVITNKTIYH